MKIEDVQVHLKLRSLVVDGTWKPSETERKASWEAYVELVTRVSVVELRPGEGLLREALASLYSLFATTRQILREHGPVVARPSGDGDLSYGYITIAVLNLLIRPVLAHWHPLLQEWENQRPADVSPAAHEQKWDMAEELRQALHSVRGALLQYAHLLEKAAGVPSLLIIDRRECANPSTD